MHRENRETSLSTPSRRSSIAVRQESFTAANATVQSTVSVNSNLATTNCQTAQAQESALSQTWHVGRTSPTRPKILEYRQGASRTHNSPMQSDNLTDSRGSVDWQSLVGLVAPLAYDLQKPLSAADQTLQSLADKIQSGNPISLEDARRLSSTASSLAVLSRWVDSVLLNQNGLQGEFTLLRRRFRVRDWRGSLQDLLESTASQRSIHLEWIGWDETLPNLYLDPNLISKAVYNLSDYLIQTAPEGSTLRLRAVKLQDASRRLTLDIQADHHALPSGIVQLINGSAHTVSPSIQAFALVTAKKLIAAHGGTLTAHRGLHGGCDLRISLPIDSAESLISSWLLANSQGGLHSLNVRVDLFAAKLQNGNAELANAYLQQAADASSMVIRVSESRWLVLELNSLEQLSSSRTIQAAIVAQRNASVRKIETVDMESVENASGIVSKRESNSSRLGWMEHAIYRTQIGTGQPLCSGSTLGLRSPHLVQELAGKIQVLLDRQPLILDGLISARRTVKPSASQGESWETAGYSPIQPTVRKDRIHQISGRRALASTEAPGAQVVSEIIRQWKIVQAKLSKLDGLAASRAG